jgi:eukaryotic-like serine/threonine-protein kinase
VTQFDSSAPVHEGQTIAGKYRVEHVLGRGGMGVVVAAMHLQLHQRVALKLILPSTLSQPGSVERLLREARAAAGLRSHNVARVLDVGQLDSGAPFIVMEFLDGANLAQVLREHGPLSVPSAVGYMLQCCDALAEAHEQGIIHRDLKPENLFLTRGAGGAPLIKVLDFGISKVAAGDAGPPLTLTSGMLGSPLYMAPEQMRSSHDVDARADIWSMGAILYELLSGEPPFQADTFAELCVKVSGGARPAFDELCVIVPPVLVSAIARCLDLSPERRFPTVAALAAALEPFSPPMLVSGRRASMPRPPPRGAGSTVPWEPQAENTQVVWADPPGERRGARRRSGYRQAAASLVLLLAGGTVATALLWSRRDDSPLLDPPSAPAPSLSPPVLSSAMPALPGPPALPSSAAGPRLAGSDDGGAPVVPSGNTQPPPPPPRTAGRQTPGRRWSPRSVTPASPASPAPAAPPAASAPQASPASSGDEDIPRLRY